MNQQGGTYALILKLEKETRIRIGRLGTFSFPPGYYVYVGSALGSGGLQARLARHQRSDKKLHWHIDYLLAHARIVGIQVDHSGKQLECRWAQLLLSEPWAQVVAPRFGASDCRCPTHLIYAGKDYVRSLALDSR
ncbi:MAG: GIY-YIG nuclease family protein [Chloroflexi bacterium]|nr:GIY-YIG nuclease family protein [Chloroflexota bacterium]